MEENIGGVSKRRSLRGPGHLFQDLSHARIPKVDAGRDQSQDHPGLERFRWDSFAGPEASRDASEISNAIIEPGGPTVMTSSSKKL